MRSSPAIAIVLLGLCVGVSACGGSSDAVVGSGTAPAKLDQAERQQIIALVDRYYAAEAAQDGARACSLLDSAMRETVPIDYGGTHGQPFLRGTTCAVVMTKMFKHRTGIATPSARPVTVVGMTPNQKHLDTETTIVSWRSPTGRSGEISVDRENGSWRVG